jgi:hypothetical protein
VKKDYDAEFTFPAELAGKKAEVIGENRTVTLDGGKLKDTFGPLDVHLYRIAP